MTGERDDTDLDALLRAAHGADAPGDDLVARVLADAAMVQAAQAAPSREADRRAAAARGGWLRGLVHGMGGWPAVSGVTLAGITGLLIGFAAPDLVDSWSGGQIWTLSGGAGAMPEIGALWDGTWEDLGDV